jgi:hypothetical protein
LPVVSVGGMPPTSRPTDPERVSAVPAEEGVDAALDYGRLDPVPTEPPDLVGAENRRELAGALSGPAVGVELG